MDEFTVGTEPTPLVVSVKATKINEAKALFESSIKKVELLNLTKDYDEQYIKTK